MKNKNLLLATLLIVVASTLRLAPQPANFSPLGAMALLSGAVIVTKYLKYVLPLAVLFVSDLILNNTVLRMWYPQTEGFVLFSQYMIPTYVAFISAVVIGHFYLKKITFRRVLISSLGFSLIFFVISNFGSWLVPGVYPKSFSGLMACYGAGLPFLKNTIVGNLFYCGIFFGAYVMLTQILGAKKSSTTMA